jgi:hypothetical protein
VQALGLIIERQLRSVLSFSLKNKVDLDKDDNSIKDCTVSPIEDIDSVTCKKRKKSENKDHNDDEPYRDFDEWF